MRRFTVGVCCLIAFALVAGGVRADDEGAGHGEKAKAGHAKHPAKYAYTTEEDGKEVKKKADLSDPKQLEELLRDLKGGEVEELKQDVPPEIIPRKFDLGIWSIIVFVVLLAVLTKFAWKPMIEALHQREETIRSSLEQAEKTRQEAMALQSQLDAKLKAAGGEIAKMMDEARRDASGLKDQFVAEAKAEIQHERDRLHREMETAKDQALQEIWQQAVVLATAISGKAIRRNLTQDDHQRLLDEALAEMKASGKHYA
jgi:F-type H+-transporting ATPase subunit b